MNCSINNIKTQIPYSVVSYVLEALKKYNFSYLKLSNKISVNKTRLLVAKFLLVPDHKPYQVFSCTSGHDWAGPLVVETQMEKEKAVAEMLAEINTHQIIPIH